MKTNAEKENPEKIMELIKKLFDMKESGILTDEEFNIKKQELLNKIQLCSCNNQKIICHDGL